MKVKSMLDTVRVPTMEIGEVIDVIAARQAGHDAAMSGPCKTKCEHWNRVGYSNGFFRGCLEGFAVALAGLALGITIGAATVGWP